MEWPRFPSHTHHMTHASDFTVECEFSPEEKKIRPIVQRTSKTGVRHRMERENAWEFYISMREGEKERERERERAIQVTLSFD